jgi:hypothetical protein
MEESLMRGVHMGSTGSSTSDDGLHALAIAFADQPQGVAREVLAALGIAQNLANTVEQALEPSGRRSIDLDVHEANLITSRSRSQLRHLAASQAIEMIQLGRSPRRS